VNHLLVKSFEAAGAVAGNRIVKVSGAKAAQAAAAAEAFLGVSDAMGAELGDMLDIVQVGWAELRLGANVAFGDPLTADAQGRGVRADLVAGSTVSIAAYAMLAGAADDIVPVLVAPGRLPAPKVYLQFDVTDLRGASALVVRAVAPVAGRITKIRSVLEGALATGDASITAAIGATDVTGGVLTLTQAGSAAGDVDEADPSAANVVVAGDVISLTVAGTNTAQVAARVLVEITQ